MILNDDNTEVLGLSVYRDGEAFGGEREERKRIGIKIEIWVGNRIHWQCRRPQFEFWVRKVHWRRDRLPIPIFLGFSGGSAGKNPPARSEAWVQPPGWGRSPGEGNCYPLQYSGLENSMDCIVHGVAKSWM